MRPSFCVIMMLAKTLARANDPSGSIRWGHRMYVRRDLVAATVMPHVPPRLAHRVKKGIPMNPATSLPRLVHCLRPMRPVFAFCALVAGALLLLDLSTPAASGQVQHPATAPSTPVEIEEMPVATPDIGQVTKRTNSVHRGGGPELRVFLFAPSKAGTTAVEHPTFYWYLTRQIEDDTEIVVKTVNALGAAGKPGNSEVIMKKTFQGTQPPGIYAATLQDKTLQSTNLYQVTVVVHRSDDNNTVEDVSSIGYLVYKPAEPGTAVPSDPRLCAQAGLWYDAIHAAMQRVGKDPADPKPHRQLHGLLWGEHVLYPDPGSQARAEDVQKAKRVDEDCLKQLALRNDVLVRLEPK